MQHGMVSSAKCSCAANLLAVVLVCGSDWVVIGARLALGPARQEGALLGGCSLLWLDLPPVAIEGRPGVQCSVVTGSMQSVDKTLFTVTKVGASQSAALWCCSCVKH